MNATPRRPLRWLREEAGCASCQNSENTALIRRLPKDSLDSRLRKPQQHRQMLNTGARSAVVYEIMNIHVSVLSVSTRDSEAAIAKMVAITSNADGAVVSSSFRHFIATLVIATLAERRTGPDSLSPAHKAQTRDKSGHGNRKISGRHEIRRL